jgi:hypothetical protein
MEAMVLVKLNDASWDSFVSTALLSLTKFRDDEIGMQEACDSLSCFEDDEREIVLFVQNTISEIHGFPQAYSELVDLLSSHPTPAQVLALMNN